MFKIEEDGIFSGTIRFLRAVLSKGCVLDQNIADDADISAGKMRHEHRAVYAQESSGAASAETKVIHVVKGLTGVLGSFSAGCVTPCVGDATIGVDLLLNGASVLSTPITLDSGDTARTTVAGTLASTALTDEDVLEVAVNVNAGTGTLGAGVFAALNLVEKPE